MMKHFPFWTISLLCILLNACVSHQELVNFNQGPAFPTQPDSIGALPMLRIQPDDALYISIHALEQPEATQPFNLSPLAANDGRTGANAQANYLVDDAGHVEMPIIGTVRLAGLSIPEARDTIRTRLLPYLKAPVVHIRFVQFKFTILGEVKSPTTFTLSEERVTLLEALGMAGDLTNYANRTNILVIREENGLRSFGRVNIQARDVFRSPYFYLRPNDVIYVEPTKDKIGAVSDQFTKALPWIGTGTAALNLIIILLNSTRR